MGNRVSSQERHKREVLKKAAFDKRIGQVQNSLQQNNNNDKQVILAGDFTSQLIGSAKVTQLERGGAIFTKADLIAILIKLEKKDEKAAIEYRCLTCDDLRSAIRLLIYTVEEQKADIVVEPMSPVPSAPPPEVDDQPGWTQYEGQ